MESETYVLLDWRGLVLHSLNSGVDPDGSRTESGRKLNTAGHAVETLLTRYLLPLFEQHRLNHIIAVLDAGSEHRLNIFPAYKAKRKARQMEPDLKAMTDAAMSAAMDLLKGLGIPAVSCSGVEADDVIAFFCKNLPNDRKIIETVDQDLIQLSDAHTLVKIKGVATKVYKLKAENFSMDIEPKYVALVKSICGDTSDEYAGVPGIGPKGFAKLIEQYGWDGADQMIQLVHEGRVVELGEIAAESNDPLIKRMNQFYRDWNNCWQLANLHPEWVESRKGRKFRRLEWTKRLPSRDRVEALLVGVGARHMLEDLEPYVPTQQLLDSTNWDDETLGAIAEEFKRSPFVALDWETTAATAGFEPFLKAAKGREYVDMLSSTIVGAGFTFGRNLEHTFYSTYGHKDSNNLPKTVLKQIMDAIPENTPRVIQNAAFENAVYSSDLGESVPNFHDTKVMASHVDENSLNGLKDLSKTWFGYNQIHYRDVVPKGMTMSDVSAEHVLKYGADDPFVTGHLYDLFKIIQKLEGTWEFCRDNEFPAIYPITQAYLAGVTVDWDEMERQHEEDRGIFDSSMARLRTLLNDNQSEEMIASGVTRLMEEWWPEKEAKLRKKLVTGELQSGATEEDINAFNADKQKAEEEIAKERVEFAKGVERLVRYEPRTLRQVRPDFKHTKSNVNRVLGLLGLPAFEAPSLASKNVTSYIVTHKEAIDSLRGMGLRWCELWADVPSNKDDATLIEKFFEVGRQILFEAVPEEDRTVAEGTELNLDSPKQMQALLYGTLDLPVRLRQFEQNQTRTALGIETLSPQADEDAILTAIAEDAPEGDWRREALESWLEARKASTRLKMFYNVYPLWRHPLDGNIHPQINSCGTETRRPSGTSPNALQWPKRGEGVKFRRCILPNKKMGHDLVVSIDWSQQELRVGGAQAMDASLLDCYIGYDVEKAISKAVRDGLGPELYAKLVATKTKDVHTQTATGSLKMEYDALEKILKDQEHEDYKRAKKARGDAKPTNFGGAYGIGPGKLSRQLMVPVEEAKKILQDKKELYRAFEDWREGTIAQAGVQGYVTTPFGSRRHVHDLIHSADEGMRGHVERQVVNYLIQGTCADSMKKVLTQLHRERVFERYCAVLVAPIYDELVFTCHHAVAPKLIMEVHKIMTQDIPGLFVPMLAEPSLGVNFADQVEIGWDPSESAILQAIDKAFGVKQAQAA